MYLGNGSIMTAPPVDSPVTGTLIIDVTDTPIPSDPSTMGPSPQTYQQYGPSPQTYQQYGPTLQQAGKAGTAFPWWILILLGAALLMKKR